MHFSTLNSFFDQKMLNQQIPEKKKGKTIQLKQQQKIDDQKLFIKKKHTHKHRPTHNHHKFG